MADIVDPVDYPESDETPMAETSIHAEAMVDLVHQLRWHLRDRPTDRYVGFDNFWYYVEGDPRKVVCPDVYVVGGVPHDRSVRVWKTWVEGVVPGVVFEVTSPSSRRLDLGPKRALYERLGVEELWLFDPLGEYLDPRLIGFVRGPSGFEPVGDRWHSPWLGLDLALDGHLLALTRGAEPRPPRFTELPQTLEEARSAVAARAEADAAHARIAELEAELARLRR